MTKRTTKLIREILQGEPYEYYPLGKYIVAAPGICEGRPTFKYTRIDVQVVFDLLAAGEPIEQLIENLRGRVSRRAVIETLRLATALLKREAEALAA